MVNFFLNDKNILILIILNALLIFIGGFYDSNFISYLDLTFTLLFIIELYLKLKKYGKKYFKDNWNIFDFILILISIPSLGIIFGFEFKDLSILLMLRTLRVFKIFRFFKFIPNIDNILKSIMRGVKTSILIIVAFSVLIFCVSILNNYMFGNYEQFSNPVSSLYNTIKIFTIEGWYEVPEELIKNMDETHSFFTKLYFTLILLLGGIFGLSFVNAILVDSMVMDNNDKLEEKVDKLNEKIDQLLK